MNKIDNRARDGFPPSIVRFLSVFCFLFLLGATPALAQTFTTIANGDWSSAGTWQGGSVPTTSGNFPSTYVINIRHTVRWDSDNDIQNEGVVRIEPTTGTTARLNLPSGVNVENYGDWYVWDGAMIQPRFVGGGNSGTRNSGKFTNKGGLVDVLNSTVEFAQDWINEKNGGGGGTRNFVNSCLITGQNFSNVDSYDTLIGSSVSIGWHGSGSFQYSKENFEFEQIRVQLAGTSGNFELNSGNAFGDIDYITMKNHVTGNVGSGKIVASSSLTTNPSGLNLDAFCSTTYESNGKFSGTQTSEARPACPLTSAYFPCVPGTPDEPQLKLVKVVTNDDGGNAVKSDFNLRLTGTDGTHDSGLNYQDSGSGALPSVTAGVPYTVSETPITGYTLTGIVCDDDDIGGTTNIGPTFTLVAGQNVTCTFTNNDIRPSLTLIKSVDNTGGGTLGANDFGISVAGSGVTSGASNTYNANTPLAINEVVPANYTFVSITGNAKCPAALGGSVTLDEGESVTCTINNQYVPPTPGAPNIDLAKGVVSGPTFNTSTKRWTVVYSVTANNSGAASGTYNLVDTLTPATGITVHTAKLTSYNLGTENSQTGTLAGTLPHTFTSGATLVTGEGLAAGKNESWTVTVEFSVNLSLVDGNARGCVLGTEEEGKGFYNKVTGVTNEANTANNDACVNLPEWDINLSKTVSSSTLVDADTFEVVYGIQAENLGSTFGLYDLIDSLDPGDGITLVSVKLTSYVAGTENSQTGTLAGALPYTFTSGDTLVTNEALASGLVESWSVTAEFDIDWEDGELEAECSERGFGAGSGFYNYAEGNIEEDLDDNHACTGPTDPDLEVTKEITSLVENPDGSYSVSYSIRVQNSGQRPVVYNLDDTLLADDSATLVAIDEGLTYDAGNSNDFLTSPDGTIETVTVGDLQSGTTTLLSDESLAGESDETWTLVLRYEVDSNLLTEAGADCVLETSETGTGFLNEVELVVDKETADMDDACTEIPFGDIARFRVLKDFSDDNPAPVEVFISCRTGLPLEQSFVISETTLVNFVVTKFKPGALDCEIFEAPVPEGYTPSYTASSDGGVAGEMSGGAEACEFLEVQGGQFVCEILNSAGSATFTVYKDWVIEGAVSDEVTEEAHVTITCNNPIEGGEENGSFYYKATLLGDGDYVTVSVDASERSAVCSAEEHVYQSGSGVESEDDCGKRTIPAGGSSSCTFTNTVFFEGIPTLSQYGMALMALLMLGVGVVGLRRFV